jgi:putative endonuclease
MFSICERADRAKAEAFERYLKSGSGHAFARKRLW